MADNAPVPADSSSTHILKAPHEPTQIGPFKIVGKIGQGGMGTVYRAIQVSLNRPVAVKILPDWLAHNPGFVERFHREARAAALLNHPNIIQVYDAGEQEGMHYFAMECVEGESLAEKVNREGALSEHAATAVAMCVAAALNYAWTKAKLIHRDIKPDNIMLTADGMVKVCDLGLAKSANEETNLTATGVTVGTPEFIAPEQVQGDRHIDTRADIYSLGVSLYFLVTGQAPFHAPSSMALMYKQCHDPLPDPRQCSPALSEQFVRILNKMTAKLPADRYQDMAEVYDELDRIYRGLVPTVVPLPKGKSTILRPPKAPAKTWLSLKRRFRRWRLVGNVGLLMIRLLISLIVLATWLVTKHNWDEIVARFPALAALSPPSHGSDQKEQAQQQANAAALAAEAAYGRFVALWQPLVASSSHDYARAIAITQNAMKDPVYKPIQARLQLHIDLVRRLQNLNPGSADVSRPLDVGMLALADGKTSLAQECFAKALLLNPAGERHSAAERFEKLRLALEQIPKETDAARALDDTEKRIAEGRLPDARKKLAAAWAMFSDTTTMKCSGERIRSMEEAIIASQKEHNERSAPDTFNQLDKAVTAKKWQEAALLLRDADEKYAGTQAAKRVQNLPELRRQVQEHSVTGELPFKSFRSGLDSQKIHRLPGGERISVATKILDALAQAHDGDGIELADGFYSLSGTSTLKNISFFHKEGTTPIILLHPNMRQFVLTESNGQWRFGTLILLVPLGAADAGLAPIQLQSNARVIFNRCMILSRHAMKQEPVSLIAAGPGSELIVNNCVISTGRGMDLTGPRRVSVDHCTCFGGSLFRVGGGSVTTVCDVQLSNNLLLLDYPAGLGLVADGSLNQPAVPPGVLKQLDLHDAHNNVVVLRNPETLPAWKTELERSVADRNSITSMQASPAVAIMPNRDRFDFRLQPGCLAAREADNGMTTGVFWLSDIHQLFSQAIQKLVQAIEADNSRSGFHKEKEVKSVH